MNFSVAAAEALPPHALRAVLPRFVASPPVEPSIGGRRRLYCETMCDSVEQVVSAAEDLRDARLAQGGDGDAYARLVRRHQEAVARRMWRFTRDPVAHEELVARVFVSAYMSLRSYRGDGPFAAWLGRIAVRTGFAFWRDGHKWANVQPLDETFAARLAEEPSGYSAAEAGELVHRALALLSPRDRLVLTLMHLEGRTVEDVARETGWSCTMVKVQAWRARARLKKALEVCGYRRESDE